MNERPVEINVHVTESQQLQQQEQWGKVCQICGLKNLAFPGCRFVHLCCRPGFNI
jgi:hypothetical protein